MKNGTISRVEVGLRALVAQSTHAQSTHVYPLPLDEANDNEAVKGVWFAYEAKAGVTYAVSVIPHNDGPILDPVIALASTSAVMEPRWYCNYDGHTTGVNQVLGGNT